MTGLLPRAAAVALVLGLLPGTAVGREIKLWPFFTYHHDPERGETHLSVLGPLVEYKIDPARRELWVRPFLSVRQARVGDDDDELTFLYPLLRSRWRRDEERISILGLLSYEFTPVPEAGEQAGRRRLTAFPFVFYRSGPERGRSLSVLPFYANLEDFLGFQRVRMVAFPGYLDLQEPLVRRRWYGFPFFSWVSGAAGSGYRLWPLAGWTSRGPAYKSRYVLWPFYIHVEDRRGEAGPSFHTVFWPAYARIRSAAVESDAYGFLLFFPAYVHTRDERRGRETWSVGWPLWTYSREIETGRLSSLRIFPFYQDRSQGGISSRVIAWPVYRRKVQVDEAAGVRYERRDVFGIIYRAEREVGMGGLRRSLITLFPFWRREQRAGVASGQAPSLLDALLPFDVHVRDLYAPLWRVYGYGEEAGGPGRREILWGLISWGGDGVRGPWYIGE